MGFFSPCPEGTRIQRAASLKDLCSAYALVHDTFVELGYMLPRRPGLRVRAYEAVPETATFIAKLNGEVVGVQSLTVDSPGLGLPSDDAFGDIIDALRGGEQVVCEATSEAVACACRRTGVPSELMRCLFAHASFIGCTQLITTVSPGHTAFYKLLGFDVISPVRSYSRDVEDPVTIVRLPVADLQQCLQELRCELGENMELLKGYYIDDNPYHRRVEAWSEAAKARFTDAAFLRALVVERGGVFTRCTAAQRRALRERWGEALYRQVCGENSAAEVGAGPDDAAPSKLSMTA
jgi:hypothetical protein